MRKHLYKRLPKEFIEDVLRACLNEELSRKEARKLLGLSRTSLYLWEIKYLISKQEGKEFEVLPKRKRVPCSFPPEVEKFLHTELEYIKNHAKKYRKRFNFAFLAEQAEKRFGYRFHRNSIRRFALRHNYYKGKLEEKRKVYVRFETPGPGFLFQHDTSRHIWLPLSERYHDLILTQDDYSRKIVGNSLVEIETTWAHMCVAKETIEEYGIPLAYYVDKHSIFKFVEHKGIHVHYIMKEDEGDIQFKRALESLDIGVIYANSPEAKGKIEKRFDYFQRRLPFLCEKYKVSEVKEAKKILEELIVYYNEFRIHSETGEIPNKRWERAIKEGKSKLKDLPEDMDLDYAFSLHYLRKVKKDGTISFKGKPWKIAKYPGEWVEVCSIPEKKIMIYKDKQKLWEYHL